MNDAHDPTLARAKTEQSLTLLPGVVIGLGAALVMWIAWLLTHAPAVLTHAGAEGRGGTAPSTVTGVAVVLAMVVSVALGVRLGRAPGWKLGLLAGGVSALVNLMLLGSVLTEQPEHTAQMNEAANRFRAEAPLIFGGFLGVSLAAGLVAGLIGARLRPAARPEHRPGEWIARLTMVTVVAMLPLIAVGGAVTSTESGMAVPDGVTSYGAVSVLFPLSLMAEPRIFLEHTHRLFGTLVGFNAIVLAVVAISNRPRARFAAIVGTLLIVLVPAGSMGANHSGAISDLGMAALTGLAAFAGLGFTHAMLSRRLLGGAAGGLLALVVVQGLMGIQRVDENLIAVAAFHGVFAQLVVATGVMLWASASPTYAEAEGNVTPETARLGARVFRLGMIGLGLVTLQLVLGAASRHLGGQSGGVHATLTHVVNSFVVLIAVIVVGALCTKGDDQTPVGRTLRRTGAGLMAVLGVQFLLGWAALGVVGIGGEHRPIPSATELGGAGPIPLGEAIVTTAHQVGGAALISLVALGATWGRRASRAGSPRAGTDSPEPRAESDESVPDASQPA
ncbi:MAG: hypothetical protein ACF8Q5_09735 [Phycisphaerales bacterium JB040]